MKPRFHSNQAVRPPQGFAESLLPPKLPKHLASSQSVAKERERVQRLFAIAMPGTERYRCIELQVQTLDALLERLTVVEHAQSVVAAQREDLKRATAARERAGRDLEAASAARTAAEALVRKLEQRSRHPALTLSVVGSLEGQLAVARADLVYVKARWDADYAEAQRRAADVSNILWDIGLDEFLTGRALLAVRIAVTCEHDPELQAQLMAPNIAHVHVFDARRCRFAPPSTSGEPQSFSPLAALIRVAGLGMTKPAIEVLALDARDAPNNHGVASATAEV